MYGYVVIHIVEALSWVEFCKFPGWWTGDDNRTKLVPGYNKILVLFCFCAHTLCVCFCLWFLTLKGSTTTKSVPVFYPLFCFFSFFLSSFPWRQFPLSIFSLLLSIISAALNYFNYGNTFSLFFSSWIEPFCCGNLDGYEWVDGEVGLIS